MRIVGASLVIFIFCISWALGQQRSATHQVPKTTSRCGSRQQLIDTDSPSAFLTFVKKERIETETNRGSDADYMFFVLTNNSCWPIWVDMSGTEDERFGDASLYEEVQDIKSGRSLHGTLRCHVCSNNPLGPGRKLLFAVPFVYASRSSVMKIAFDFDWEKKAGVDGSGVSHTVDFYFNRLPESILPK